MAPFQEAASTKLVSLSEDLAVFEGLVDAEWTIASVPNGGFIVALILDACIQLQAGTPHTDPLHVTVHYLDASEVIPFQISIRKVKSGRSFVNLEAKFVQKQRTKVLVHLIFTDLKNLPPNGFDLVPPSPYVRRLPLYSTPETTSRWKTPRKVYTFASRFQMSDDDELNNQNLTTSSTRTDSSTVGGDSLVWGGWVKFNHQSDRLTPGFLALCVDVSRSVLEYLPKEHAGNLPRNKLDCFLSRFPFINLFGRWYPTLVMTIEFKFPISSCSSSLHSQRTVGVYTKGQFVNSPHAHHDLYNEVWTAPSEEGLKNPNWRDNQRCLAVSTQMATVVDMSVNLKKGVKL
ncbi:thioesterase-like superfamily-domain-containing protein [Mycena floridula]|nr:thioesterase-like superfamily-domain-containing protein [Mycena floridula]